MDRLANFIKAEANIAEVHVEIIPSCNGGMTVVCDDPGYVPGVLAAIAEAMSRYELEDLQITTNQVAGEIYIDEVELEEE